MSIEEICKKYGFTGLILFGSGIKDLKNAGGVDLCYVAKRPLDFNGYSACVDELKQLFKKEEIDLEKLSGAGVSCVDDLKDFRKFHLIERLIKKVVDAAVGMNQMILREKFNATIKTARESFADLATDEVLESLFAHAISKSVGLRNKIIHEYDRVDLNTLYESITIC